MMQRRFLGLAISLLVGISVVGCKPADAPHTGSDSLIEGQLSDPEGYTPEVYDFGRIVQGKDVFHDFVVSNPTSETISFPQPALVDVSCCMSATLSSETIPPGGQALLSVAYHTRLRPGPFSWKAKIFPSDARVHSDFEISGEVSQSLVVEPIQLDFGKSESKDCVVYGDDIGSRYKIKQVISNSPHLKVTLKARSEDDKYTYSVAWDGKPIVQEDTPAVYVITDDKDLAWYPVLIYTPEKRN